MMISAEMYRRIAIGALVALCTIVVTGATVRLTGSGLGCSDWPTCEQDELVADWELHPMVEFLNRLFTGAVSVAVALAVLGSLRRRPRRADLTRWSWMLVAGVFAQVLLGALTVKLELTPPIVMAHFLVSMVLVWAAVVLVERAGRPDDDPSSSPPANLPRDGARSGHRSTAGSADPGLVWLRRVQTAVAAAVLFTGTVVTGSGPHGGDADVERLNLSVQSVARTHSLFVWALCAVAVVTGWRAHRTGASVLARRNRVALAVIVAQGAIGYIQYFSDVPPALVAVHVLGAVGVWITVLGQHLAPLPAESPADKGLLGVTT